MSVQALEILLNCDDQGKAGELPAYAWPGGYVMFYVTEDGSELCAGCATRELKVYLAEPDLYRAWAYPPVAYGAYGATDDYPEDSTRCDECNVVIHDPAEA